MHKLEGSSSDQGCEGVSFKPMKEQRGETGKAGGVDQEHLWEDVGAGHSKHPEGGGNEFSTFKEQKENKWD